MLQSVERADGAKNAPVEYSEVPSDKRRRSRFWLVFKAFIQTILAFLVLFGAVNGMNRLVATKPEVSKRPVQEKSYSVETETAVLADNAPVISVYGEATAGRQVDLRALVGGEIVEVSPELKAGGVVSRGDELVAIDRFDYEGALTEAKANLAEAEAQQVENNGRVELERANVIRAREQLDFAQKDLERAEDLLTRGSVTERTVDERKLLVSQRQQVLEQRLNTLALERAKVIQQDAAIDRANWGLKNAERQLTNTVLKAPFDAVVRSEAAQVGRLISVNDVVASIFSSDELEVRFTLSDNQYGRLVAQTGTVVDRPVEVLWYLGNQPLVYQGIVDRVGADVASTRGGVDVFAKVAHDASKTPLRPGAFVEVMVSDQNYNDTFRLPETALYGRGRVYVIRDDRLEERTVEPLAFDDGFIIVRGGLEDGDTILLTRIPEAGEGLLISSVDEPRSPDAPALTPGDTAANSQAKP